MGQVIGPINACDWHTLLLLKQSVSFMKKHDRDLYRSAIDKETKLYKKTLNPYLASEAA